MSHRDIILMSWEGRSGLETLLPRRIHGQWFSQSGLCDETLIKSFASVVGDALCVGSHDVPGRKRDHGCQRCTHFPALCHSLLHRYAACLSLQQDFTLAHYVDGTVLIGPCKQEIGTTLHLLVRHVGVSGWEIKQIQAHGPSTSVKIVGVQ